MDKKDTYMAILDLVPFGLTAEEALPIIMERANKLMYPTTAQEAMANMAKALQKEGE